MNQTQLLEMALEQSPLDGSQFTRLKRGNLWFCLSSKIMKMLQCMKEEVDAAIDRKTLIQYNLIESIVLIVDTSNDSSIICFKKPTANFHVSLDEWGEMFDYFPENVKHPRFIRVCTSPKTVRMYGCYQKSREENTRWFFSQRGAIHFGQQQKWEYGTIQTTVPAPDRDKLLHHFLAFHTRNTILARVSAACSGCQLDKPIQEDHTCLDLWSNIVEKYYVTCAVKFWDVLDGLNKLIILLRYPYNFHGVTIRYTVVKDILMKNEYKSEIIDLFQEIQC